MMPDATIVEERNADAVSAWTLFVRGGGAMSASYPTEAAALADAPLWCGARGRKPEIVVIPYYSDSEPVSA